MIVAGRFPVALEAEVSSILVGDTRVFKA